MRKVVIAVAAGLALAASSVTGAMAAHGGGGSGGHFGGGGGGGHFGAAIGGGGVHANTAGGGVGALARGGAGPNFSANTMNGNHMRGGGARLCLSRPRLWWGLLWRV
jgi:hypothetical protein